MRKIVAGAGLALSACAASPPPAGPGPIGPYTCRNDGLDQYVGQPASQQLGADMLRTSGARTLRWVAHGMVITMEFNAERLTVYLAADNRVERASCG